LSENFGGHPGRRVKQIGLQPDEAKYGQKKGSEHGCSLRASRWSMDLPRPPGNGYHSAQFEVIDEKS